MAKVFVICMTFLFMALPRVSAAGNLTDNGNGSVTDSGTALMWQQGENSSMTWEEALSFCEGLSVASYSDWRLPNVDELTSLVDDTKTSGATIDTTLFQNAIPGDYWSSTTDPDHTSHAWVIDFAYGGRDGYNKKSPRYVRCVRGGR